MGGVQRDRDPQTTIKAFLLHEAPDANGQEALHAPFRGQQSTSSIPSCDLQGWQGPPCQLPEPVCPLK